MLLVTAPVDDPVGGYFIGDDETRYEVVLQDGEVLIRFFEIEEATCISRVKFRGSVVYREPGHVRMTTQWRGNY